MIFCEYVHVLGGDLEEWRSWTLLLMKNGVVQLNYSVYFLFVNIDVFLGVTPKPLHIHFMYLKSSRTLVYWLGNAISRIDLCFLKSMKRSAEHPKLYFFLKVHNLKTLCKTSTPELFPEVNRKLLILVHSNKIRTIHWQIFCIKLFCMWNTWLSAIGSSVCIVQ